jgi:hypothetical protein
MGMKRIEREWTPAKASGVLALMQKLGVVCDCESGAVSCLLLPPLCERSVEDEDESRPPGHPWGARLSFGAPLTAIA